MAKCSKNPTISTFKVISCFLSEISDVLRQFWGMHTMAGISLSGEL